MTEQHCVVAFAGHMIDQQSRPVPRFPPAAEGAVRVRIRQLIAQLAPQAAIASAACGGDIIFAEEILRYGAPLYVILPFADRADFVKYSVAHAGAEWIHRFEQVCAQATLAPYFVKPGCYRDDKDFEDNQRALLFFALGVAAARNMRLVCLILCDEKQLGDQIGGTRSFLEMCRDLGVPHQLIDIAALREGRHTQPSGSDDGYDDNGNSGLF